MHLAARRLLLTLSPFSAAMSGSSPVSLDPYQCPLQSIADCGRLKVSVLSPLSLHRDGATGARLPAAACRPPCCHPVSFCSADECLSSARLERLEMRSRIPQAHTLQRQMHTSGSRGSGIIGERKSHWETVCRFEPAYAFLAVTYVQGAGAPITSWSSTGRSRRVRGLAAETAAPTSALTFLTTAGSSSLTLLNFRPCSNTKSVSDGRVELELRPVEAQYLTAAPIFFPICP